MKIRQIENTKNEDESSKTSIRSKPKRKSYHSGSFQNEYNKQLRKKNVKNYSMKHKEENGTKPKQSKRFKFALKFNRKT